MVQRSVAPRPTGIGLEVAVAEWRFRFVLDVDPSNGQAREVARTVALVTGCGVRVALAAVLEAIASPTFITFKAAA